jgi:hypothetical protein
MGQECFTSAETLSAVDGLSKDRLLKVYRGPVGLSPVRHKQLQIFRHWPPTLLFSIYGAKE